MFLLPGSRSRAGSGLRFLKQNLTSSQKTQARSNIAAVLRGHLWGLTLSTAGASATFSVSSGEAADSVPSDLMTLSSAISKTTSAWAVGSGNGALDTASIAASTWYHVHLIKRPDTGVVDVLISLSATAPTLPANYTIFRRIGSMKTNGSSQWTKFIQDGNVFMLDVPVSDVSAANPGTAAVTRTLANIPLGIRVQAYVSAGFTASVSTDNPGQIYLSDLSVADTAASGVPNFMAYQSPTAGAGMVYVFTNTSSQIRSRVAVSTAGTTLTIVSFGWIDTRGRV